MAAFEEHVLLWLVIGYSWGLMLFVAIVDLIVAGAFRQTMLLRLFGLTVVTRKGESASRLRLFWRSLVAWLPVFVGAPFLFALAYSSASEFQEYGYILVDLLVLIVIAWLAAVVWTVLSPSRAAQDWLAGTVVTPR